MTVDLTSAEFRQLLDMVYIGNWILNSTRGDDRFTDYDEMESKLFALCRQNGMDALVERWHGEDVPSKAFSDGGIHEAIMDYEDTVFYEILAEELAGLMERFGGVRPPVETLDITLYRDDLSELGDLPEVRPTQFSTPVAGKTVIYTGRTARAAMEAVIRLGRPARIRLAVMVDRGHRELPIDPEYVGKNVPTAREEQICVLTPQFDGQWGIHLRKQA